MEANIAEKFHNLLDYLLYAKSEFEIVADEIGDCRLKTALYGFSEESEIYINEICSHLQVIGIAYHYPKALPVLDKLQAPGEQVIDDSKGNELQYICNTNEQYITATYYDILNGYFPFPVIREIMVYQLNTLKSILKKICFLNLARFSN